TGFPQQTGESDFSITQVNIDGQVTVRGTISGPSGSVVGGELRPLSGKLGGVSSAQRHFIPGPWGSSSTRFTLQASTPATASIFSGVMNVRPGGGQNQEIAYWGQPWRFETEMAPTATKVANIDGSF
ncbi:MAG TPA: hypothetical protein VFG30_32215, partial [Polyangiales bacterium]|nr:hypothetical protein [Polyangiales bacterium]